MFGIAPAGAQTPDFSGTLAVAPPTTSPGSTATATATITPLQDTGPSTVQLTLTNTGGLGSFTIVSATPSLTGCALANANRAVVCSWDAQVADGVQTLVVTVNVDATAVVGSVWNLSLAAAQVNTPLEPALATATLTIEQQVPTHDDTAHHRAAHDSRRAPRRPVRGRRRRVRTCRRRGPPTRRCSSAWASSPVACSCSSRPGSSATATPAEAVGGPVAPGVSDGTFGVLEPGRYLGSSGTEGGPMTAAPQVSGVDIDEHVYRRRWWILAVLCTSLMIVIVGNTSLNVALPTLARDLDATSTQLQWMVDAYSLVFAGLLFTAGALGDRYGRKGALQLGLLIFLGGSLLAALLGTSEGVIIGRAVMGFGAAFVMPSTLSVLANVFPRDERTRAIAIWAGVSGAGAALGPIASGFLLEHFFWGSVFYVNVPVILLALIAGRILIPKSSDPEQARLDPVGAVLSIAGLVSLVYAIIEAPRNGWGSPTTLAWFAAAAVFIGGFVLWELRSRHPMLDLHWFKDPRFSVASFGIMLVFFAMFGMFFLITQYFQLVLGYGTFEAGLAQLPVAFSFMLIAPRTPQALGPVRGQQGGGRRPGRRRRRLGAVQHVRRDTTGYPWILVTMVLISAGMAATIAPLTGSIMSAVPASRAGVGSAMNDTTRELGGALGVAVLGSLVLSQFQSSISGSISGLPEQARNLADSGLAGALQAAPAARRRRRQAAHRPRRRTPTSPAWAWPARWPPSSPCSPPASCGASCGRRRRPRCRAPSAPPSSRSTASKGHRGLSARSRFRRRAGRRRGGRRRCRCAPPGRRHRRRCG